MSRRAKAYFSLAGSMTLAGSSVVVGKSLTQSFPVFLASGCSLFIALAVLIPITLYLYGTNIRLDKKTLLVLFLQGFTGTFLFRVFLFIGLKYTSASAGGLITSSAPAIVALLAFIVLKERLPLNKILGIAFTVAGILIVNISGASGGNTNTVSGNILVLLAVTGEASFSIFSKFTESSIPPILKTTVVCFFAFLCFIPFSIYDLSCHDLSNTPFTVWLALLYYGIFVTVIAFILWFKGISETPASTSAVFSGFMPLSSILLSSLVLKENINITHVLSLLMISLGILATIRPSILKPDSQKNFIPAEYTNRNGRIQ